MPGDEALSYLEKTINRISGHEFQMVVLPEKWITSPMPENDPVFQEIMGFFQELSEKNRCSIVPGSFSIERNGGLYNSSPFIHEGKILGFQDKISLFKGENGKYSNGNEIRIFNAGGLKVSIAVCYDLDFPYFAKVAAANGASLIVNPSLISSEFRDMWHIYVKGRSLETRLSVVSINSLSDPFLGGSIVTRMKPGNGGVFLEQELLGSEEARIVETNPEEMRNFIEARQAEDPGFYGLNSR